MKKIAIITVRDVSIGYEDQDTIVQSISDWAEVSDEEYTLLRRYLPSDTYILEFTPVEEIPLLVKDFLKKAEAEKEAELARKKAAAKKKRERDLKKKAKTEEQERLLLEELKRKYEDYSKKECVHKWEYDGHGHNYTVEKCSLCNMEREV